MAHASARRRPGRSGRHRHRATRHVSEGNWWVARNDGEGFVNENWGAWSANVDWLDVLTADFDGDGRDDVVGRANGKWWVARSDGSSFVNERWGTWTDAIWRDAATGLF